MSVVDLPYLDIQHDALAVIDDVEQGVVPSESIWVSAYRKGSTSTHGKVKISQLEGGGSELASRDGVDVQREGKTGFRISAPALKLRDIPVRFPRQSISPAYVKKTSVSPRELSKSYGGANVRPALTINSLAHSVKRQKLAVAGPDGYLSLISTKPGAADEAPVECKGHVGDVLDVKFFPSGEVVLSTSSDLSIRIFGLDGSNPRTFKGHTRAVTCTAIVGVGKEIVSGSRDGTVRLWNVGQEKQVRKWFINPPRAVEAVFIDTAAGDEGKTTILACRADGVLQVFDLGSPQQTDVILSLREDAALVSAAWDAERRVLATGHSDGVITLRQLPNNMSAPIAQDACSSASSGVYQIRRNESSIYSLHFTATGELCVGTAAGLPCKLAVRPPVDGEGEAEWKVETVQECAGWDATGVEAWCDADEEGGVWCAGAEAVVRRY